MASKPYEECKPQYWLSPVPHDCQLCSQPLPSLFFDASIRTGQWAIMCEDCHQRYGKGLGTGRGQRYTKVASGWLKTGG